MNNGDRRAFLSALGLTGERDVRRHLEAGHYRGKKWQDRREEKGAVPFHSSAPFTKASIALLG